MASNPPASNMQPQERPTHTIVWDAQTGLYTATFIRGDQERARAFDTQLEAQGWVQGCYDSVQP